MTDTRPTPFDAVFGALAEAFDEIRADASRLGRDPRRTVDFPNIPTVQRLLENVESPALVEAQPAAAAEYLIALYAAYRFWDAGRRVLPIRREALEPRLAADPPAAFPAVPAGACYLQLPERWIWARVADDEPYEPVDGILVAEAPAGDELTIVAVLGVHPDRGGFSQVSLTVPANDVLAARHEMRTPRFAPAMPGGEAAGLRSIVAVSELLVLMHLALALHAN